LKPGMDDLIKNADSIRIRRLIRVAAKASVGEVKTVLNEIFYSASDANWVDVERWNDWYDNVLFDAATEDDMPDIVKATLDATDELMQKALEADPWWKTLSEDNKLRLWTALIAAYQNSMSETAHQMASFLYEIGSINNPYPDTTAFDLKDKKVLAYLDTVATAVIKRTNDGSGYYLRRIVVSEVRRALSNPEIAQGLVDGTVTLEQLFDNPMWMGSLVSAIQSSLMATMNMRMNDIPGNEEVSVNRMARTEMYKRTGLKKKAWRTLGANPCVEFCIPNEKMGFVPIDHVYLASYPEGVLQPQAHNHCECDLVFDKVELMSLAKEGKFRLWNGEGTTGSSDLTPTKVTLSMIDDGHREVPEDNPLQAMMHTMSDLTKEIRTNNDLMRSGEQA
jgi:hypothetical protein